MSCLIRRSETLAQSFWRSDHQRRHGREPTFGSVRIFPVSGKDGRAIQGRHLQKEEEAIFD